MPTLIAPSDARRPSQIRGGRRASLAATACWGAVFAFLIGGPAFSQEKTKPPATDRTAAMALEASLVHAIDVASESVVAIARVRSNDALKADGDAGIPPDPASPDFVPNEFGTGVVFDTKEKGIALIVTNQHVVGDPNQNRYYVWHKQRPFLAKVKASDPWTDLAVLQIEAEGLKSISLGDGSKAKRGQIVISLGNPYAISRDGQASAAWGIVSNLSRQAPAIPKIDGAASGRDTLHHYGTLIQVDAKLNLGTSGGALVDLDGKMIGLTTSLAALTGFDAAAGFAIPVDDTFRKAVTTLSEGKVPEFGFLGLQPGTIPLAQRQKGEHGALVQGMVRATPASKAGLLVNDIITHVDKQPVVDDLSLIRLVSSKPAGATVELTVSRPGDEVGKRRVVQASAVLSKKPTVGKVIPFSEQTAKPWRGLIVESLTAMPNFSELSRFADLEGCVAVFSVANDSPAANAKLRGGMLISHVGNKRVDSPAAFAAAVASATGNVELTIVGIDGTSRMTLTP
jgi:serine protease Do